MDLKIKDSNVKPKIAKLADDPCYGLLHEQIDQCTACWVKKSCATSFRNYQAKRKKK